MKKIFALIIILLFSVHYFFLYGSQEDSLLNLSESAYGIKKLETLHKLQQLFLYETKDNHYNNLLLEEAILQRNIQYQSIALSNKVAYHYRFFDTDSIFHYAEIAENFTNRYNLIRDRFLIKELVVRRYLEQGHFSLGLKKAHDMNEEASKTNNIDARIASLIALSEAYRAMDHPDEAIQYMTEALAYDKINPTREETPYKRQECYSGIILAYKKAKDYDQVLIYCDSLRLENQNIKKRHPTFNLYDFEMGYLLYSAEALIYTGKLEEANRRINEADGLLNKEGVSFFHYLLNAAKAHYYTKIEDWDNAWLYYDTAYNFCIENQLENETRDLLKFKSSLLSRLNKYEEAVTAYKELSQHIDSVNRERFLYEINELRISYEVDKKETQIAQQEEKIHLRTQYIIFLAIFAVLLLIALFFILKYSKEITKKNHLLFNHNKELTQTKMQLLAFKESIQQRMGKTNDSNGNHEDLYEKVELFMTTNIPYVNSEYGRRNLITDMNTNEVYLAKAIREAMNMTIQEYINFWRTEHSKYLLLKDMNQTIEAVAMDSGFTSLRNFYRLFKDAYGMSPSQFRNYVRDNTIKNEKNEADGVTKENEVNEINEIENKYFLFFNQNLR